MSVLRPAGHAGARDPCAGRSPPGGARNPCADCSPPGGARNPCADCSPPGAALARPAIRGSPAAIAAGRGQAAAAPLSAPHKGRVERRLPLCYPHLCLARSYRAHASTSGGGSFHGTCPTVCGAACINAVANPLFAAQPTKVFCRAFFQKSGGHSRLKFFAELFFKKAGGTAD